MARALTITLGDLSFTVRPFTLGEYEDEVVDLIAGMSAPRTSVRMATAREILAIGWRQTKADAKAEDFKGQTCSPVDLIRSASDMLVLSGFKRDDEAGKAQAGAEAPT